MEVTASGRPSCRGGTASQGWLMLTGMSDAAVGMAGGVELRRS